MKINPISQSDAISKYVNNINKTPVKNRVTANISDSLELSEGAQKFSALIKEAKEAVEKLGAGEEAKSAAIASQIDNNSYDVSSNNVVNDILSGIPSNL